MLSVCLELLQLTILTHVYGLMESNVSSADSVSVLELIRSRLGGAQLD